MATIEWSVALRTLSYYLSHASLLILVEPTRHADWSPFYGPEHLSPWMMTLPLLSLAVREDWFTFATVLIVLSTSVPWAIVAATDFRLLSWRSTNTSFADYAVLYLLAPFAFVLSQRDVRHTASWPLTVQTLVLFYALFACFVTTAEAYSGRYAYLDLPGALVAATLGLLSIVVGWGIRRVDARRAAAATTCSALPVARIDAMAGRPGL